jgi:transposase InsO family protein
MQREYPIQLLCEVLEVSRSCYYAWKKGQTYQVTEKNKTMEGRVIDVFRQNKRRYGSRRIVADLRNHGHTLSRYKARKLLSCNGLRAIQPRSFVPKTTNSRHRYKISPNLLKQRPAPIVVNEVWVGDISYIPLTNGSFQYLSVWMDLFSRKVVGWDLQDHMRESLVIASLQKATGSRNIKPGLLIHSDRGGQYAGAAFRKILDACNMQQSMSDADNPYDNAHMESFFSRFKTEMLEGGAFHNAEDSRIEIFEFIEMYYNPKRLHSSIGYLSPNTYEKNK